PRVEIVFLIPRESLLHEERPIDLPEDLPRLEQPSAASPDARGQILDPGDILADVQGGISVPGDLQRDADQAGRPCTGEETLELGAVTKSTGQASAPGPSRG